MMQWVDDYFRHPKCAGSMEGPLESAKRDQGITCASAIDLHCQNVSTGTCIPDFMGTLVLCISLARVVALNGEP